MRLAILSPFAETPVIPALELQRNPAAAHAFRRNCLEMNEIGERLCEMDAADFGVLAQIEK